MVLEFFTKFFDKIWIYETCLVVLLKIQNEPIKLLDIALYNIQNEQQNLLPSKSLHSRTILKNYNNTNKLWIESWVVVLHWL